MSVDNYQRIVTPDGSVTYLNTEVGATYRSVHGAESESRQVFLQGTGLPRRAGPWRVLELGFGTGLNFKVTMEEARRLGVSLEYLSLEPAPLPRDLWLVPSPWMDLTFHQPYRQSDVTLTVTTQRWQDCEVSADFFHALYHDPFGPGQAPECWTADCFHWSHAALTCDGVLATFGAAGATRRALKEAGYLVGVLPGANGKREMTVACKTAGPISHARPWKREPS